MRTFRPLHVHLLTRFLVSLGLVPVLVDHWEGGSTTGSVGVSASQRIRRPQPNDPIVRRSAFLFQASNVHPSSLEA